MNETSNDSSSSKRVGIIQSSYIPWRGYFDFIDSVDLFIILDDIPISNGRDWRNRNRLKTREGLKWVTIPLKRKSGLAIDQVLLDSSSKPWQDAHRRVLIGSLEHAPYFRDAIEIWEEAIASRDSTISQLNIRLIKLICDYLKITTPIVMSRDCAVTGAKTERLIELLKKVEGTIYLSGPSAKGYLDENLFRENKIRLEYKTYHYEPYPQLWGDFVGNVTVLDLIANTGPNARQFLKSKSDNIVVIP